MLLLLQNSLGHLRSLQPYNDTSDPCTPSRNNCQLNRILCAAMISVWGNTFTFWQTNEWAKRRVIVLLCNMSDISDNSVRASLITPRFLIKAVAVSPAAILLYMFCLHLSLRESWAALWKCSCKAGNSCYNFKRLCSLDPSDPKNSSNAEKGDREFFCILM